MTDKCMQTVLKLQETCEGFCDLTVEQLLWAAIVATDIEDVVDVLLLTEWQKYVPDFDKNGFVKSGKFRQIINIRSEGSDAIVPTYFEWIMERVCALIEKTYQYMQKGQLTHPNMKGYIQELSALFNAMAHYKATNEKMQTGAVINTDDSKTEY